MKKLLSLAILFTGTTCYGYGLGSAYQVIGSTGGVALTNITLSTSTNGINVTGSGSTITFTPAAQQDNIKTFTSSITVTNASGADVKYNLLVGSITFSPTTAGVVGTTAADSASAGYVGEYISSTTAFNTIPLANGVAKNILSMTLTAGDWDVRGNIVYNPSGTTVITLINGGINTTSATLPSFEFYVGWSGSATTPPGLFGFEQAQQRINVSGSTTVYLVTNCNFSASTMSAGGTLTARRVR